MIITKEVSLLSDHLLYQSGGSWPWRHRFTEHLQEARVAVGCFIDDGIPHREGGFRVSSIWYSVTSGPSPTNKGSANRRNVSDIFVSGKCVTCDFLGMFFLR